MKIIIQTRGFDLTPAIEAWVNKKSQKIFQLDKTIQQITVSLVCNKNNGAQSCQASYDIDRAGQNFNLSQKTDDLYEAISLAANSVIEKLRRDKE